MTDSLLLPSSAPCSILPNSFDKTPANWPIVPTSKVNAADAVAMAKRIASYAVNLVEEADPQDEEAFRLSLLEWLTDPNLQRKMRAGSWCKTTIQ